MVSVSEDTAYMAVIGRATYLNCRCVSEFLKSVLEKGRTKILIDFRECTGMDSTFLGIIAGVALKLNKVGGEVAMLNLSERNRELVDNLGIFKLVKIAESTDRAETTRSLDCSGNATHANILSAHENLVEINPANLAKFEDVITFLKKEADMYK